MTSDFKGIKSQILSITLCFPILIFDQEPVLCLWYDTVWGLNPGPPALKARTLPVGYRGGSVYDMNSTII